jgi:flagellar biogenesis protein FliO
LLLAEALPADAQVLGQGGDDPVSMWRVAAALLLCILLAVGGAFALRMRMGADAFVLAPQRNRRLKLVEVLRLSPQSMLCIVDCDGRELLVMASPAGAELLDRLPPRETHPVRQTDGMS